MNVSAAMKQAAMQPDWRAAGFGLYIHWPFCLSKCPYCDFNSHVAREIDHARWREALTAEMAYFRALTGPRQIDTIFFGGGTPSLMEPSTVEALIAAAERLWGLAPGAEITLEANPTSVEAGRFRDYARAGVNRVSVGVQALSDADLVRLGRTHSAAEALAALQIARATFERVSFDLIYARMGQSVAEWETELAEALALDPDHLSLYQLTIEPGTRFGDLHQRGRLALPADETAGRMYELTQAMTGAAGLPAYEISNHARPGAESRHNLIYWRYGDYAGIGAGAHGRITTDDGRRLATETRRDPAAWIARADDRGGGVCAQESIASEAQAEEYLMMALRLTEGAELARYRRLAGVALDQARIDALANAGMLRQREQNIAATPAGRLVLNRILADLLA